MDERREGQRHERTGGWREGREKEGADGSTDGRREKGIKGGMDVWMDGRTHGWKDG